MPRALILALLCSLAVGCDYCGSTDDDADEDDSSYRGTGSMAAEGWICIADTDGELRVQARVTAAPDLTVEVEREAARAPIAAAALQPDDLIDDADMPFDGLDEPEIPEGVAAAPVDKMPYGAGDLSVSD